MLRDLRLLGQLLLGLRLHHHVVVHVDAPGDLERLRVVLVVRVAVLDQVIPGVPLPHDLGSAQSLGRQLDDGVWPEPGLADLLLVPSVPHRILLARAFPDDRQHVAVRHRRDVVVLAPVLVRHGVVPEQLTAP